MHHRQDSVKIWDKYFVKLIDSNDIQVRVLEIADRLNKDYEGKRPVFIPVLNGSFMFAADLLRNISLSCEINFMRYSSYQGTKSSGKVQEVIGATEDMFGRHLVVIEDIVDSGLTLSVIFEKLLQMEPLSIRVVSLLYKPSQIKYAVVPDYTGFEIANDFVVGYGLDYNGLGRNLPHIYQRKEMMNDE